MKNPVITIDGPAASGKSTVAAELAKKLGWCHLNSGLLFRAVAHKALKKSLEKGSGMVAEKLDFTDKKGITELSRGTIFKFFVKASGETELLVDGMPISSDALGSEIGSYASKIAVIPELREVLLRVQRDVREDMSLVVDGRDAGSVVFSDAEFKFYLDAPIEVRARRKSVPVRELEERDERDSTRSTAPQIVPPDAIVIDTSDLTIEQVVEKILERYYR